MLYDSGQARQCMNARPRLCMHARPLPARPVHSCTAPAGQGCAFMHGPGRPGPCIHARPGPANAERSCAALASQGRPVVLEIMAGRVRPKASYRECFPPVPTASLRRCGGTFVHGGAPHDTAGGLLAAFSTAFSEPASSPLRGAMQPPVGALLPIPVSLSLNRASEREGMLD